MVPALSLAIFKLRHYSRHLKNRLSVEAKALAVGDAVTELIVRRSNELIDPQAQLLVDFLKDMGLPSENIIADAGQRKIIGDNLHSLIRDLPHTVKKDARYLSKFVVGAGFGLFDYSLNAVWNEVVINLRKKAVV